MVWTIRSTGSIALITTAQTVHVALCFVLSAVFAVFLLGNPMAKATTNFFFVNRDLLHSRRWLAEPFSRGQAWVDLFGLANHTAGYMRTRGVRVDLQRGQLGYSQLTLAKRWKWSRDKVRRYLRRLETAGDIIQQNTQVTTIISIVTYDTWQGGDGETIQQTTQQTRQQKNNSPSPNDTHTNKKEKKEKKNKNKYKDFVMVTDEEHTNLKLKFGSTLDAKIQALNDYIGSTGKKYKSHYFTILSWARRNGETDKPKEKTCMEIYLEGDDGKEYLKTQEGLDWLQTEDGRRYAASRSG